MQRNRVLSLIVCMVLFASHALQAEVIKIKDFKFLPEEDNKVFFEEGFDANDEIKVELGTCGTFNMVGPKKKITRYKEDLSKRKTYTKQVSFSKGSAYTVNVNGVQIKGDTLHFELKDNCTKLSPVYFESAREQMWDGVKLEKDAIVQISAINEMCDSGRVSPDTGYIMDFLDYKYLKNKTKEIRYDSALSEKHCLSVVADKTRFYMYDGKRLDDGLVTQNFWNARSKYYGHVLCSNLPKAEYICGCENFSAEGDEIHKNFPNAMNEELRQELLGESLDLGEKCDQIIAEHEKKTGKKVPVSKYTKTYYRSALKNMKGSK